MLPIYRLKMIYFTAQRSIFSDVSPVAPKNKFQSGCVDCLRLFQVLDNIRIFSKGGSSVSDVIEKAAGRITLYMSHLHRAVVQELRIGEYIDEMRRTETESSAVIILDYKMKLQQVRYRETSVELYGKRGMGWHGSVAIHRT